MDLLYEATTTLAAREGPATSYAQVKACVRPLADNKGAPLSPGSNITIHWLMVVISGPCLIITFLACWFLSFMHLRRYTAPQEQRQILRIVNLPAAYCLFNFLALTFVLDYMFIQPIGDIYEAFVVAAMFYLALEFICPDGTDREKYFDNLEQRDRKGRITPGGSLKWFQRTWTSVLQYPLLKTILVVVQIVTQYYGVYCESSWHVDDAHLWCEIADILFIGGALGALIRFASRIRKDVAPVHRFRPKIWSVVIIIAFQFLQKIVFATFNGKLFKPNAHWTYNDIYFGIACFMTCIECVIFIFIFQWSFSSSEYKEGARLDRLGNGPAKRIPMWRAILDALNPTDIISGSILAFQLLFMRVRSRYGGRGKERSGDQVHLEPLSNPVGQGYDGAPYEAGNGGGPAPVYGQR